MRVRVWGCRGSLATPGRETVRYGGNTSCLEVVLEDGTILVLDAGTGARALGLELEPNGAPIHLLLTHLHLDHLEGLGFFTPIWQAQNEVHIWGPSSPSGTWRRGSPSTSRRRSSRSSSPTFRRSSSSTTCPTSRGRSAAPA